MVRDAPTIREEGKIKEFSASQEEIAEFLNKFDRVFIEGLHLREFESLALIMNCKLDDTLFCPGDATAIQALAMIDFSDLGIYFLTI